MNRYGFLLILWLLSAPSAVCAGYRSIKISIPNDSQSSGPLEGVRAVVVNPPGWLNVLNTSQLGPVTIFPGRAYAFRLDFEVNSAVLQQKIDLSLEISHSNTNIIPQWTRWTYTSSDGFLTASGTCLDDANNACGDVISPDSTPPVTNVSYLGPFIHKSQNTVVSPATLLNFVASDASIQNAQTAGPGLVMIGIDGTPQTTQDLTDFFLSPFSFPPGSHTVNYASFDEAGNIEPLNILNLYVDGIAPSSPVNMKAEGVNPSIWKNVKAYNLTWTSPSDVSGVAGARVKFGGVAPVSNSDGIFFTAQDLLDYPTPDITNGQNVIWVWLEDNVGNADPANRVQLTLRYDDIKPVSNAIAPEFSKIPSVPVAFAASDEGVADLTGSGMKQVVLWYRINGGAWASGGYISTNADGTFNFDTQGTGGSGSSTPRPSITPAIPSPLPSPLRRVKLERSWTSAPPLLSPPI